MFAPISVILSLFLFASTLPNGIRLVELPPEGESVEVIAGYTSGGLAGLVSTSGAKSFLTDAYAAGGSIEFIHELDRTALRVTAPKWALSMLLGHLPGLFKDLPEVDDRAVASPPDFRANVEEEIRSAILGAVAPASRYATADAFVLISAPIPDSLRNELAGISKRGDAGKPDDQINRLPAERTLRFKSDLPTGAVIFASPIPGVYYKQWYLVLLLDRLIHRTVPLALKTALPLTVRPYYYRLELAVPAGQFPEPAEETLLQELQRLQFTAVNARELAAAKQETLDYLAAKDVREWFASHDLAGRREEGTQWIQSMTSDDMRAAARDLLIMNRVIATWAPKARQTAVAVEPLTPAIRPSPPAGDRNGPRAEVVPTKGSIPVFPAHADPTPSAAIPERLPSGVSLVASTTNAVFISGGPLTRFDHELTGEDLKSFQQYRADRILVLAPPSSIDRIRVLCASFRGSSIGDTGVPKGRVSSGDLSALFLLKILLDLKLIEAGSWGNADVRIDASEGSGLQIRADEEIRAQISDWIKAIANGSMPETYLSWAREVAVHQFDSVRADIQALIWERDPLGTIQDPATISPNHVQDVARIYF